MNDQMLFGGIIQRSEAQQLIQQKGADIAIPANPEYS